MEGRNFNENREHNKLSKQSKAKKLRQTANSTLFLGFCTDGGAPGLAGAATEGDLRMLKKVGAGGFAGPLDTFCFCGLLALTGEAGAEFAGRGGRLSSVNILTRLEKRVGTVSKESSMYCAD